MIQRANFLSNPFQFSLTLGLLPLQQDTAVQAAVLESAVGRGAVPTDFEHRSPLYLVRTVQALDASAREAEIATGERRLIELDGDRAGLVDCGKGYSFKIRIFEGD